MSSHFIHINFKKNHDRHYIKTIETNNTTEDKTKSKSSIIVNNPKNQLLKISRNIKEIKKYSYNKLIKKYNTLPYQYNLIQIEHFINGKYCHSLASFKEKIMFNYTEEFLKKFYRIKEINKKIPLFYQFYKSYLQFFCSPIFADLDLNELIEKAVEKKAKAFYNENYKEEPEKKTKTMNIVFFTSKIRRDLSRRTNLTNLSKTTIMERNLTNKSSITSAKSIAKIFNEIGSSNVLNNINNNINNKNIDKNKSFNKNNGNKNSIDVNNEKKKIKKNNIVNIHIKNGNTNNKIIRKSLNNKNKLNKNNINSNLTSTNINTNDNINSNNIIKNCKTNYNITDINNNSICPKVSIKKITTHALKIKDIKPNNNLPPSSIKLYINKNNKEIIKKSPLNNVFKNPNNLNNKSGNNTTTNISINNKKINQKPNSRNYVVGIFSNKNTFSHLDNNIINKINSSGKNLSNNNKDSLNKSLKKQKLNNKIINNKKKVIINQENKNILNNININIKENNIKIQKDKNEENVIKKEIDNKNKIKKNINDLKYKKISPYKKPDLICGSITILKGINRNISKKKSNKMNNYNTIQPKNKVSNIKTNWSNKDKNSFYKKQNLNLKSNKESNKTNNLNKK